MVLQNYINQLITYLLDKLIGKYVQNFTTQNVKTGLYQGDVKLVNLPLKSDVLESLTDWPIKVKKGEIGSVSLRVPYTQLRSQAWAIMLDEIYIVAGPDSDRKMSKEKFAEKERNFRKILLESLEIKWWNKIKQRTDKGMAESNSWMSYVASFGNRVLRNIQIEIRNVHIRYEDTDTISNSVFSVGLFLDHMAAKSSDFDWNSKKDPDSTNNNFEKKLVVLKGIGFYIDTESTICDDLIGKDSIKKILEEKKQSLKDYCYVIRPISFEGQTKRYTTSLPLIDNARIQLKMDMEEVELSLSQAQFRSIIAMLNEFDRFNQKRQHLKNRPDVDVKSDARKWWQFAIGEVMSPRMTEEATSERCSNLVKYAKYYESYLLSKDDPVSLEFRTKFEEDLDIDIIVFIREICMEKASRKNKGIVESKALKTETQNQGGWWSYLWKSKSLPDMKRVDSNTSINDIITPPTIHTETSEIIKGVLPDPNSSVNMNIEEDISQMLYEVDEDAVNFFTRDRIFLLGEFLLPSIKIFIRQDDCTPLMGIQTDHLSVKFEARPQSESFSIITSIANLQIDNLDSDSISRGYGAVVSSVTEKAGSNNTFNEVFFLAYEKNPLSDTDDTDIRHRLLIRSTPLKIVHSPLFIEKVTKFFTSSKSNRNLRAAAKRHLVQAKIHTRHTLKYMLEKSSDCNDIERWQISLMICAPRIILPELNNHKNGGKENRGKSCVLVDLGQLTISNCSDLKLEKLYRGSDGKNDNSLTEIEDGNESFYTPTSSPTSTNDKISTDCLLEEVKTQLEYPNDEFYENYSIRLEQVRVLVGSMTEVNQACDLSTNQKQRRQLLSSIGLVQPCNLVLDLKRKTKKSADLPNIALESRLSKILITISDKKLLRIRDCFMTSNLVLNSTDYEDRTRNINLKRKRTLSRKATLDIEEQVNKMRTQKQMTANFNLTKFSIQLETRSRPLAELTLTDAHVNWVRYSSWHTQLDMTLYSLVLADARAHLGPELDFVVASHQDVLPNNRPHDVDQPLIRLQYKSLGMKRNMKLTFSDLSVIANQETLSELLSISEYFQQPSNSKFQQPIPNNPSVIPASAGSSSSYVKDYTKNCIEIEIISTQFSILLVRLKEQQAEDNNPNSFIQSDTIYFPKNGKMCQKIGLIVLMDIRLNFQVNNSVIKINSSLKSIDVTDLDSNLDLIYRDILTLSLGESSVLKNNACVAITLYIDEDGQLSKTKVEGTLPQVLYVHSPQFIHQVELCISDFQHYLSKFKQKMTDAATKAILSNQQDRQQMEILPNVNIDLKMLSPIMILPKNKVSLEIFIIKLGDMVIKKDSDALFIHFTDANVTSKYVEQTPFQLKQGFEISKGGFPVIDSISFCWKIIKSQHADLGHCIFIDFSLSSSLSISMSKEVYEQILKSADNLVFDEEAEQFASMLQQNDYAEVQLSTYFNQDTCGNDELPILLNTKFNLIKFDLFSDNDTVVQTNPANCNFSTHSPVISMALRDLTVEFIRRNKYIKDFQFTIGQLTIHQVLDRCGQNIFKPLVYSSRTKFANLNRKLSLSCPKLTANSLGLSDMFSGTLPRKRKIIYNQTGQKNKKKWFSRENINTNQNEYIINNVDIDSDEDALMTVKVKIVDRKSPNFRTEYNSFNRFIDANFNKLTLSISMEIWVILLDFFGLGSKFYDPKDLESLTDVSKVLPSTNKKYDGDIEEINNIKLDIKMQKLTIVIENQIKYADYSNLMSVTALESSFTSISKDGNLNLMGSVNDFNLCDLSPTGSLYRYRVYPASNKHKIFEFDFFKYGLPDQLLLRNEDIRLKIKVSAPIVYIHTQRFLSELNQFAQNFMQYQDRLREIRVTSAGRIVDKSAPRASRILFDVNCEAPLLVLPVSAFSDHLVVADLGHFSVNNKFNLEEAESSNLLLDNMTIHMNEIELFSAHAIIPSESDEKLDYFKSPDDIHLPYLIIRPRIPKPFPQKLSLVIQVVRNLDSNRSHAKPDWQISAQISSLRCWLDIEQYRTIRGVLAHNLGENIDFLKSYQYQAFQTDPRLITNLSGEAWLGMTFDLNLTDVQVNLKVTDDNHDLTLCCINFLCTTLSYNSFSDSNKVIELFCNYITVEDMRYENCAPDKQLNVFPVILTYNSVLSDRESSGQVHIRYQTLSTKNIFDVKLNKMRIGVIFDWLMLTHNWLFMPPFEAVSLASNNRINKEFETRAHNYILSKSETLGALPAIKRYQEITTELFRSTVISLEAQESNFYVLEDSTNSNSAALILTVAGTFSYKTRENKPGPFSLKVSQLHLASCSMPVDGTKLLSIINPVEIQMQSSEVIEEKMNSMSIEVNLSSFKIRLSFHDMRLLANIATSLFRQSKSHPPVNLDYQLDLESKQSSTIYNTAESQKMDKYESKDKFRHYIANMAFNIKLNHIDAVHQFMSICLIDDCVDADVPLFDLRLGHSEVNLELSPELVSVKLEAALSLDYYNTNQFTWMGIIDQWQFQVESFHSTLSWKLKVKSNEPLDLDFSSQLLNTIRDTYQKWHAELQQQQHQDKMERQDYNLSNIRSWVSLDEFAPFIIENRLGVNINFRKLALSLNPLTESAVEGTIIWSVIHDSSSVPVRFESERTARDKIRYNKQGLHYDYRHRIEIQVEGWEKSHPITVDKLGVFYRDMQPQPDSNDNEYKENIRIIIEIIRQGSVQNKIILRSALMVRNTINIPLEILMEQKRLPNHIMKLQPMEEQSVPLQYVQSLMRVRPMSLSQCKDGNKSSSSSYSSVTTDCVYNDLVGFSSEILSWYVVKCVGQRIDQQLKCDSTLPLQNSNPVFLICSLERLNFPTKSTIILPGHIITISAPFTIENLLPCDLKFNTKVDIPQEDEEVKLKTNACSSFSNVRSAKKCTLLNCSSRYLTKLYVSMDGFPRCDPLVIPGDSQYSHDVLICVYDEYDRLLELHTRVESRASGPIVVTIYAPYWIVNRTSLPLVYAQSNSENTISDTTAANLAAGYSEEHEQARSPIPFMFSFNNRNEGLLLQIRLGNKFLICYGNQKGDTKNGGATNINSKWSQKISIDRHGTTTIQLRAIVDSKSQPVSFNIGLEVRAGRGRHRLTNMVLLTERYILDNRSRFGLHFSQYQLSRDPVYSSSVQLFNSKPILALPNSVMTFHWPREDLDPLLSVQKLDSNQSIVSKWSGGFLIDKCNSFHVYLKGVGGYPSSQLRITVTQEGAIYRVVFTDVDDLPSPYRLENMTRLQIFFHQEISDSLYIQHHLLPPHTILNYALDHPIEPQVLNLSIEGGTQACFYLDSVPRTDDTSEKRNLCYDNFLYLTVVNEVNTKNKASNSEINCNYSDSAPLVFDVPQGSRRIVLRRKMPGCRSQLWFHSTNKELFHEGSIAPHDPKQRFDRQAIQSYLLLDIDMLAPQPSSTSPEKRYQLVLAKPDPRRTKYQRWYFTEDGCLMNQFGFKCTVDRYMEGAVVTSGYETDSSYYIYQEFLRPGSGIVDVTISADGPTRVVRIQDRDENELVIYKALTKSELVQTDCEKNCEIVLDFEGLGVFLITDIPEELIYISWCGVNLYWRRKGRQKTDACSFQIRKIQVDNQQSDCCIMFEPQSLQNTEQKQSSQTLEQSFGLEKRPAFSLKFERQIGHNFDVHVFNYIKTRLIPMSVILEEKLILKVLKMFTDSEDKDTKEEEDLSSLQQISSKRLHEGKKVYIGKLQLLTGTITLSVITAESLDAGLKKMKRLIPSLMGFTNAQINIDPYDEEHIFETWDLIGESILTYMRQQLKSQAINIFGTVDFLGNPLGFMSDISSGVRLLYAEKNLKNVVRHFAHGIGDSTAKICGSASRLMSEIAMDPSYARHRQELFEAARQSDNKSAQMVAGLKSMMHGIYGGIKSVPTQAIRGCKNEGFSGLVLGTVKGVLGVVAKPVGGMLDLATGTATSFREIARSSREGQPARMHQPRLLLSSSVKLVVTLPTGADSDKDHQIQQQRSFYQKRINRAQKILSSETFSIGSNSESKNEKVIGFVPMQTTIQSSNDIEVLITDRAVHMVKCAPSQRVFKSFLFSSLINPPVARIIKDGSVYVKLLQQQQQTYHQSSLQYSLTYPSALNEFSTNVTGPLFKCDSLEVAQLIVDLISEAYSDYIESMLTLS